MPLLPDIFALVPSGRTMGIRNFGLSWFHIHINSDMLPHLQSLGSYRLHHHTQVSTTPRGWPPFENSLSWISLRVSGVNLQHLDVDYVDSALVDYLDSSSGLETLRFTASHPHVRDFPEGLARQFFAAMSRHAKSLKLLSVLVPPDSQWCFCTDYTNSLLLCEMLEMLSMSTAFSGTSHESDVVRCNI
jgi:hypothetical protein